MMLLFLYLGLLTLLDLWIFLLLLNYAMLSNVHDLFYHIKRFASVLMLYLNVGSIFLSLVSQVLDQQGNHVLGFYKISLFLVLSRLNSVLISLL